MAWALLAVLASSIGCWYYFRKEDEGYSEFAGRHIGLFIGAVNGAIKKSKEKTQTEGEDETQEES